MRTYGRGLLRAWTRWAYFVNGCDPARIDDPDEQDKYLSRMKKGAKSCCYTTGVLFVLLFLFVLIGGPDDSTFPQVLGWVGAFCFLLLVGIGSLLWATRW